MIVTCIFILKLTVKASLNGKFKVSQMPDSHSEFYLIRVTKFLILFEKKTCTEVYPNHYFAGAIEVLVIHKLIVTIHY